MDSEMIERVAKALFEHASIGHIVNLSQYSELKERNRELWKASAVIAIKAMREPTENMKIAGSIDPGAGGPDAGYETEVWQAMLDCIIND